MNIIKFGLMISKNVFCKLDINSYFKEKSGYLGIIKMIEVVILYLCWFEVRYLKYDCWKCIVIFFILIVLYCGISIWLLLLKYKFKYNLIL